MKKGNSNGKFNRKEAEIAEYLAFAEFVSELGDAIDRYYPEDLVARTKTAILPHMFDDIEDYNYFMEQIENFFQAYTRMLAESRMPSNMRGSIGNSQEITLEIIKDLDKKFPNQLASFVLLHVLIERKTPYIIEACLKYLKGKNAYVERLTQDEYGYKYIEIASTDEMSIEFLNKEYHERDDIGDGLRKLTKDELDFLTRIETISGMEFLSPQDFVYAAKDSKYAGALFFNMASYNEFAENKAFTETENSIITLIKSNIQYLNLNKLKMLMLCRALVFAEQIGVTQNDSNVEYAEKVIKELLEIVKTSRSSKISSNGISVEVLDWKAINFEAREQRRENTIRSNPLIYALSSDTELIRMGVSTERQLDITTREVIESAQEFLEKRNINRFFDEFDDGKLASFDFDLRKPETVKALRTILYTRIKEKNPDASVDEIEDICFQYAKKVISELYQKNLVKIIDLRKFDESATCELISEGVIDISNSDLSKNLFSKQAIVYLCCVQPNRLTECLDKKYITKADLLAVSHIPTILIKTLFENRLLNISELFELIALKKIDLSLIKNSELNKEILMEQLDSDILSELYINIIRKKAEYEIESKANIEKSLAEGIDEEKIEPSENEIKLQNELQVLINQKNVFVYLLKYLELKGRENIDFSENTFLGVLEHTDDMYGEFIEAVEEMYKDGIVSMEQIKDLDSKLLVVLVKRGTIRAEDIEEFKKHAVSEEELEEFKEILDVDEYLSEVEQIRYAKLQEIVDEIIKDFSISNEEKLGIIYSIFTSDSEIEKRLRDLYETKILNGEIDSTYDISKEGNAPVAKQKKGRKKKNINDNSIPKEKNGFVYSPYVIWQFLRIVDPNVSIKVYKDGNVTFCSEKLNKAVIESVWKGNGENVERSYGVATISMSLDTFENNFSNIVVYGRNGYKINGYNAKAVLPTVLTPKGVKSLGIIRHNKDLSHSGRKNWFDLLLEDFGICLQDIKDGKDTRYALEDAERIEAFLKEVRERNTYERI